MNIEAPKQCKYESCQTIRVNGACRQMTHCSEFRILVNKCRVVVNHNQIFRERNINSKMHSKHFNVMFFVFTKVRSRWRKESKQTHSRLHWLCSLVHGTSFQSLERVREFSSILLSEQPSEWHKTIYTGLNFRLNWPKNPKNLNNWGHSPPNTFFWKCLYCLGFCIEKLNA